VVDNHHSQLVTCGTVFQGICYSRRLSNISLNKTEVVTSSNYQFVASTKHSNPAVAFVAPGPSDSVSLYVGTDDRPSAELYQYRQYTCGVTRRHLIGNDIFGFPKPTSIDLVGSFAYVSKNAATSPNFVVKYVTGFSVGNFSYFISTQPVEYPPISSTPIVSKLAQVCHQDKYFDSYVEMPIVCRSSQKDYKLIQAASLVQPGSRLGLPSSEYLLAAVFYGQPDSALCVYPLSDIRRRFTDNIQACHNSSTLYAGKQFVYYNDRYEPKKIRLCKDDTQVRQRLT